MKTASPEAEAEAEAEAEPEVGVAPDPPPNCPRCEFCNVDPAKFAEHGCTQCRAYFCSPCLKECHSRGAYR